jgi:hypothetical protein
MSVAETQQGFPKISAPLCNNDLTINQIWLQLLITLWNRTGAGQGASTLDALLLAISGDEISRLRDDINSGNLGNLAGSDFGGGASADTIAAAGALASAEIAPIQQPLTGEPLVALLFESAFAASSASTKPNVPRYAPGVTGALPGPQLLANVDGTCIMVKVGCVVNDC